MLEVGMKKYHNAQWPIALNPFSYVWLKEEEKRKIIPKTDGVDLLLTDPLHANSNVYCQNLWIIDFI